MHQGIGLSLENSTVQLNLTGHELRVHLLAIAQEVLRVPEHGLNLGLHIHVLEDGLTFIFCLAVRFSSGFLETFTSINDEEEIRLLAILVVR